MTPAPAPHATAPARPVVVITEPVEPQCREFLAQRCEVIDAPWAQPGALAGALPRADAMVVRTSTRVDARLLALAPHLRVVGRAGVGVDNIDLRACAARSVAVVHTPGANTSAVVEFVLGALLDAQRPRRFLDRALTPAQWESLREDLTAPRQVEGLTLGVLGFGRVGSRVASLAGALGATVLNNDLLEIPEDARAGARPVPFETLLSRAEALTFHVDGRPANRGLIGARAMTLLRPDVLLVNTSRGLVLDEPALGAFLRARPHARAILDVHAQEPFPADSPLLGLPNASLTPHIGAATRAAHEAMSWVVRDVWRVLNGEAPEHPAPPARPPHYP